MAGVLVRPKKRYAPNGPIKGGIATNKQYLLLFIGTYFTEFCE